MTFHESIWVLPLQTAKRRWYAVRSICTYHNLIGISSGQMKSVNAQFTWGVPLLLDRLNIIDRRPSVGLTHMCIKSMLWSILDARGGNVYISVSFNPQPTVEFQFFLKFFFRICFNSHEKKYCKRLLGVITISYMLWLVRNDVLIFVATTTMQLLATHTACM